MIRVEEAVTKVPPLSLDMCVAATVGTIGVLLERALRSAAARLRLPLEVIVVVTLVRVEIRPGDEPPPKPIGPRFTRYRAEIVERNLGWRMIESAPDAWRRVVPWPTPAEILNLKEIAGMMAERRVVIAGGGGGVPVTRDAEGRLAGVEAVVDKDHVACMLALALDADRLVILTDVEQVCLDYERPSRRPVARMSTAEAASHLAAGQFPPGSMGPKIEAAVRFAAARGKRCLITSPERLAAALAGETGTWIEA
jgi:carbamate kinase